MKTFKPIITSLLDKDLYKLTMLQAMFHQMPGNTAEYEFDCRTADFTPDQAFLDELNKQLDHLCTLRYQENELQYLATRSYFKSSFIEFLRLFQFNRQYIRAFLDQGKLRVKAKGPQIHVMDFEIFVLAIVNELNFRRLNDADKNAALNNARTRLAQKVQFLRQTQARWLTEPSRTTAFEFFDFGTRRRMCKQWHREMVQTLKSEVPQYFRGTSNLALAMEFNLTPIGTMAHEWLQSFQAMPGVQLAYSQRQALECWVKEYRGELGIALTDVIGMDAFLADFDLYFAKLFDGLRQDSGDPMEWAQKAIKHYEGFRIDPLSKRLTFSNGLTIQEAVGYYEELANSIKTGFGIGTSLSHDCEVIKPLNVVMKLLYCNGQPTAKISDSPGKTMCADPVFINYLKQVFHVQEKSSC